MKFIKKIALYLIIILGIMYGYQAITGRSITTLPQEIASKFNEKGSSESTNPKYLSDPAKRMPKDL